MHPSACCSSSVHPIRRPSSLYIWRQVVAQRPNLWPVGSSTSAHDAKKSPTTTASPRPKLRIERARALSFKSATAMHVQYGTYCYQGVLSSFRIVVTSPPITWQVRVGAGRGRAARSVRRRCNGEGGSWWTFTGRLGDLASLGCFPKSAFSRVIDRPKYVRIALLQYYRPLDSAPAVLDVVLLAWTRQNIASIWNRQFLC